jgi:hypothetical protein
MRNALGETNTMFEWRAQSKTRIRCEIYGREVEIEDRGERI